MFSTRYLLYTLVLTLLIPSLGQVTFSGGQLGQNWYHRGMPIFSENGRKWISSKTGEHVTLEKFHLFGSSVEALLPSSLVIQPDIWDLPDRNELRNALDLFFASSLRLVFPVLDPILSEGTLETAYEPFGSTGPSLVQLAARAHVMATASVLFRLQVSSAEPPFAVEKSPHFAAKARLLLGLIPEEAAMTALEAVLMLVSSPVVISFQPTFFSRLRTNSLRLEL